MAFIEIKDVRFSYAMEAGAEKEVLHGINLDIGQGEFVALLGHNGCGKSTMAKLLNGMLSPSSGQVLIDGLDAGLEENQLPVRRQVGLVLQNPDNQLVAGIVEEDVAFGPENLGVPPEEIRRRVDEALKAVDMYHYREHAPHKLSGGQKQRVAIAGVIAMEPQCIVLDEPTAMLDPNGRKEVIRTVQELRRRRHVTVILITHYMEEVIDADQVYVMDSGHIVMKGTPREIFSRTEELKKYRLDVPQATMLADELRKRGLPIPRGILRKEELVEAIAGLPGFGRRDKRQTPRQE